MTRDRIATAIYLGAALLWQAYVVVTAYRNAATLRTLLAGIGGRLPAVTHNYFATYRYWPLVTLVFLVLSADVLRRPKASRLYFAVVLAASVLAALFLQAWLNEAWFRPLFVILREIG